LEFPTLFEKSGAEGTYRRFKFEILRLIERNEIPGYDLLLEQGRGAEPTLRMIRRTAIEQAFMRQPTVKRTSRPPLTDDALAIARKMRPRQDIYALKADFDSWLDGAGVQPPDDYQKAFCAYVASTPARA
jgi:hypothetical protein